MKGRFPHEDVDMPCCGATKCFTEASDAWRVNNDWVEEFLSIGPMTGRAKVLVVLPREMRNSQKSIRYMVSATFFKLVQFGCSKKN